MSNTKTKEELADHGYSWVTTAKYNGITKEEESITDEQETIRVPNFNGLPTARVTVSGHMTKNLGNYESARIGVEVSLPCYPVEEEIVRVYSEIQELVSDMLDEQLKGFDPVK
jgi:hypothetical protein